METARADVMKALLLLLLGLAAGAALVALFMAMSQPSFRSMKFVVLLLLATIYGLGRGTWLVFDARRRYMLADRMRQPPTARVVQRERD